MSPRFGGVGGSSVNHHAAAGHWGGFPTCWPRAAPSKGRHTWASPAPGRQAPSAVTGLGSTWSELSLPGFRPRPCCSPSRSCAVSKSPFAGPCAHAGGSLTSSEPEGLRLHVRKGARSRADRPCRGPGHLPALASRLPPQRAYRAPPPGAASAASGVGVLQAYISGPKVPSRCHPRNVRRQFFSLLFLRSAP